MASIPLDFAKYDEVVAVIEVAVILVEVVVVLEIRGQ
jgi:hypothetical protein